VYTSRIPAIVVALPEAISEALESGAEDVADGARERVPVDHGDLRDSIHTEPDDAGNGFYVVAGNSDVFYGHMVEHGTVKRGPHPFLIPALEANAAGLVTKVGAAVKAIT